MKRFITFNKKKHAKDRKIYLKKEKKKGEKSPETDIKIFLKNKKKKSVRIFMIGRQQNLSEEEKQKKFEYMRNCYLAHKKYFLAYEKQFFKESQGKTQKIF